MLSLFPIELFPICPGYSLPTLYTKDFYPVPWQSIRWHWGSAPKCPSWVIPTFNPVQMLLCYFALRKPMAVGGWDINTINTFWKHMYTVFLCASATLLYAWSHSHSMVLWTVHVCPRYPIMPWGSCCHKKMPLLYTTSLMCIKRQEILKTLILDLLYNKPTSE